MGASSPPSKNSAKASDVPVVVRSAAELHATARLSPHAAGMSDGDVTILMAMFLADAPTKAQIATLDVTRSPPDEFVVRGREIYLRAPNGFARTKLSNAWFDSRLGTISTGRNWKTVLKLLELTR